ncbi:putative uncharacterized protein DDB_G0282133 isoform X2 [Bradysia coprophila]|uniref:putative uncharacterized protein DDB_G0282133 isoform X2 n=1 Tax=Bradysia coprophila TaxID=38358 RepID=UPI00187DCAFA|nr:putative uncharacterized protein DDB_G0282133 isoform X2 [Bradysia coprophila]
MYPNFYVQNANANFYMQNANTNLYVQNGMPNFYVENTTNRSSVTDNNAFTNFYVPNINSNFCVQNFSPNFYVESANHSSVTDNNANHSSVTDNNANNNVYAANFYTKSSSNPNFYVENNADDHHFMPDSSPSCSTNTSRHENIGQSTSVTEALNGITHSMKEKSSSSKPERKPEVSRRNLFKIRPIKYNCESPPLLRPVQVLVRAKNAQSNNIHQDMGHRQSTLMTDASVITQCGRDNSTPSPLMKPVQQSHRNLVTAKNDKSNSIHSMHHNMGFKLQSATINPKLHRNLVETKSTESNSSSSRLAKVVHRLQSSLVKANHTKSNSTHTMHHTMAHKLQSPSMSEALNGITHSVRHNSTSSPLEPEQVSHRNLVETKSTESNSSSSRLTKVVHRLQSSLVKAKHTKLINIHSMNRYMGQKRQSTSMAKTLNLMTHSVRDNLTPSPLVKLVSHSDLVKTKNAKSNSLPSPLTKPVQQSHHNLVTAKNTELNIHPVHQDVGHDLEHYLGHDTTMRLFNEFVAFRSAQINDNRISSSNSSNQTSNNKSYEVKRLKNNIASREARINRKKREDELSRRAREAEEQNYQIHAELDKKYEELSELMYLIALLDECKE